MRPEPFFEGNTIDLSVDPKGVFNSLIKMYSKYFYYRLGRFPHHLAEGKLCRKSDM